MLTFLRFARPVKTPTRSVAVCALILGTIASCTGQALSHDSTAAQARTALPPASTPLPEAGPQTSVAPNTAEVPSLPEPAIASLPALELSLELPYAAGSQPTADGRAPVTAEELLRWNAGSGADASAGSNSISFHPGTRVIVETRPAKRASVAARAPTARALFLDRVQAQARSHGYWPFRRCFERAQREQKMTGGETRILFTIGTRGKVRKARLLEAELGARGAADCLVREVLKLEFTPRPTRALAMLATIAIYPGDSELAEPSDTASIPASAPQTAGPFDPVVAGSLVAEKLPELRQCFAAARSLDPALWGRLALAIVLEVDGSVHRVSETESHFPNAGAVRCVAASLASVRFPSVDGKPFSFVVALRLGPPASDPASDLAAPNSESVPSSAQPLRDED